MPSPPPPPPRPGRAGGDAGTLDGVSADVGWLAEHIRDIPDYPKPGVTFRDITPLLADATAFGACVDALADVVSDQTGGGRVDKVLGMEARGFILAAPVAYKLGAAFVPVRKAGKLPWAVAREEYSLEYGDDRLEIHRDAIHPGERVLVVDDVLATGGTAAAVDRLVNGLGGSVAGFSFLIELAVLGGRSRLSDRHITSLLTY